MSEESVAYNERADWIVEQASRQGMILSRRQLADWHRAGLIPAPKREILGGRDGSTSLYPRGTLAQVLACSALMKQFGSVDIVGWELWMRGFLVHESFWCEPLRQAYHGFGHISEFAVRPTSEFDVPELNEAADRFIDALGRQSEAPRRMGIARRRLRGSGFAEFVAIVVSAVTGAFKVSESAAGESTDPITVLSRVLGTEPGKKKRAIPASPMLSVTGESFAANLEAMSKFLPRISRDFAFESISEAQLASARNELSFLVRLFLMLRQNEARIVPGSTPDLALVKQIFKDLSPTLQAASLLIWLAVRDIPGWRENLASLRQAVSKAGYLTEFGKFE